MSVAKSERGKHDFLVVHESKKLVVNMVRWLEKDFRQHSKRIKVEDFGSHYNIPTEQSRIIENILNEYNVGHIEVSYDRDIVSYFKNMLLDNTIKLRDAINEANEIFVVVGQDYFYRRHKQYEAKGYYRTLVNNIHLVMEVFDLKCDTYLITTVCRPTFLINKLLKGWIETDKKRFAKKETDGTIKYVGSDRSVINKYYNLDDNCENESVLEDEEIANMLGLSKKDLDEIDPKPKNNLQEAIPIQYQQNNTQPPQALVQPPRPPQVMNNNYQTPQYPPIPNQQINNSMYDDFNNFSV